MPFLDRKERAFLQAVARLGYCNPFLPERVEYERQSLGAAFEEGEPVWSMQVADPDQTRANAWKVAERIEAALGGIRERIPTAPDASEQDLALYEDAALYLLYHRYADKMFRAVSAESRDTPASPRWSFYRDFFRDWQHYFEIPGIVLPSRHEAAHTFACFFQISRAFVQIFGKIIGSSMSAARLRAAVWQSIFTHDIRRYRRTLYRRMGDFATLITGPSGTGKELVARAIAFSRYVPFDERKGRFGEEAAETFHAVNLAALSPTLIESELFGHRRGAFTGAVADRRGWLETCPPTGTVFLDEIGDLDPALQVKLLRVIETRLFQPVGDTSSRRFEGKLIAATNRPLPEAMRDGRFREDLYYRLCADQIVTPPLREQLRESPAMLGEVLLFMARRVVGEDAEPLAREVEAWVGENLGAGYPWPGNYRELEQCVRNVLIRKLYQPPRLQPDPDGEEWVGQMQRGELSAEELLRHYAKHVHAMTGSYQETGRRLQLDRRTVKSKVDG